MTAQGNDLGLSQLQHIALKERRNSRPEAVHRKRPRIGMEVMPQKVRFFNHLDKDHFACPAFSYENSHSKDHVFSF